MTSNVAKCLLISKVLVADGMMGEDERVFLTELMTQLGLNPDEKKSVIELEGWDEAEGIVNELPLDDKLALIELLVDAASADGHLSPTEMATIKRVEQALGIK
ncbi:MAG TPA: TerB family tellurite resistance protein [Kofleriaceae bacterium]|nr:TerB family tellurite resistance protein [Kofleriaceae bacterium]